MKFARGVVRLRVPILVLTVILLIPAVLGMVSTRVNYDMLTYLPGEIDTVVGQDQLMEEFHKGAFSFLIFEDMPEKQVAALKQQVERIDHVDTVLWYDSLADLSIPMELLPKDLYQAFNTEHSTMMAVFFDSSTSADETMEAVEQIRAVCGKQCFVSGMTALVVDLRNLCEREEPIYVGLAVLMALIAMLLLLDNYLIPFVFLASIGAMILMNLGTNYFLGEISYITKALSAVLQLAVTMDYSIFLWHGYQEQRSRCSDRLEAMAQAIHNTLTSVVGSSVTTIAGFIALCFMSFTLGRDLGLVMAKGVLLGVIGCVTVLPALILVLDRPLQKLSHRPLILRTGKLAARLVRIFPVFLILFALIVAPALYGYVKANDEVYYDLGRCLPEDINYAVSRSKLSEEFDVASTHMVLVDADLPAKQVRAMLSEMEQVDGVKYAVGLESLIGDRIPAEFIPERLTGALRSENLELLLINSRYLPASDAVNAQIDELNAILKRYDPSGKLIGEAPCMKDMISISGHDFQVVTAVSVAAIFLIILFVEKSLTLPLILIAVIEVGIFINLGLPHYLGSSMSFITPICISTIQLGATVDYAILMTTRYKAERVGGKDRKTAVTTALAASIPSILVSGTGLFAATFGVALYSDVEIISSMCMLMARGAVISMLLVILILPAMLLLFDRVICKTTLGMTRVEKQSAETEALNHA
ncbi:MAG: MMPL family transporter [Oscillospiraceae bacterium]|nr:MMPL family transporter [Oscillospiraceae bacterium]